jgi:hypothetical protein
MGKPEADQTSHVYEHQKLEAISKMFCEQFMPRAWVQQKVE